MRNTSTILVVDDEPDNLKLMQLILKNDYQLLFANSGKAALGAAEKHRPDLILMDIMLPDMDGYEACRLLKASKKTEDIPLIFVTAMGDVENESLGFDLGAVDYIQKPVSIPIVLRRVQTHLSLIRASRWEKLVDSSIRMLGKAGHYNDSDTGKHIWRMAQYAGAIATGVGWTQEQVEMLKLAAPMHDTGKIGIPDHILKAPRKLTDEEWEIMRRHPKIGYEILSTESSPVFQMAAEIALGHHEKWDGSGYPSKLVGETIPESCRIVALADVFDALTMKRPYKEAWPIERTLAVINEGSGSHFEPRLVSKFNEIIPELLHIKQVWRDDDEPEEVQSWPGPLQVVGNG